MLIADPLDTAAARRPRDRVDYSVAGWALTPLRLLAFAAGACAPWLLPVLPPLPVLLLASGPLLVMAARQGRAVVALLACLLAGLAWSSGHGQLAMAQRLPATLEGADLVAVGRIDDLPRRDADGWRFRFCPERAEAAGSEVPVAGCWRLAWYARQGWGDLRQPLPGASDLLPVLEPGARWRLTVRLRRPRGLSNPGGFDRERQALEQGITAVGYVRDAEVQHALTGARGLHAWRARIADRIDAAVPDRPRIAALLRGLAVGDRRGFGEADWRTLRRTGTSHLFAISGLHVGMIALVVGLLVAALTWLWPAPLRRAPRRLWVLPMALLAAFVYALLAGFQIPVQRALILVATATAVALLRRSTGLWQAWCLALVVVLLLDPMAMLGIGFWLSFLGVAWLLLAFQGRGWLPWWRAAPRAQWAVALGLLPVTIGFFAQASWLAPLVNLVAIPWLTVLVVPVLLLALVLLPVAAGASTLLLQAAAAALAPMMATLDALAAWPAAAVSLPEPGALALLGASLAAALCLLPLPGRLRLLALPLALPLLLPLRPALPFGAIDTHVLDVGQGTAVLLRTRGHALLFDTGARLPSGYDLGEAVVVPALQALGVQRLDALVISHADNDHAGGAASVLAEVPVTRVLSGEPVPGLDTEPCQEGQRWHWDGVEFELLHPPASYPTRGNERSCVLRVTGPYGGLLLPGDAGDVAEMRMLNLHRPRLPSQVLLLGHHGSNTSSGAAFLDAVAPRLAIATAGYRNRFGHPHRDVLQRLHMRGIEVADSVSDGAIAVHLGPEGLDWQGRRSARRRFWNEP